MSCILFFAELEAHFKLNLWKQHTKYAMLQKPLRVFFFPVPLFATYLNVCNINFPLQFIPQAKDPLSGRSLRLSTSQTYVPYRHSNIRKCISATHMCGITVDPNFHASPLPLSHCAAAIDCCVLAHAHRIHAISTANSRWLP